MDIQLFNIEGWQTIPILNNDSPLVPCHHLSSRLITDPQYYHQNIPGATPYAYLREGVASRLVMAANLLPAGYRLVILDAWRPLEVQEALHDIYREYLQFEYDDLDNETIEELVHRYIAHPSTDPKAPCPHFTGAAVDVTIMNHDDDLLDMGSLYNDFGEKASIDYFEKAEDNIEARTNRRLLFHVMTSVGFTNYSEEWWHYDFGNQFWAKSTNSQFAHYGYVTRS
jgi:D-alanyl-D-alanine dipeptidase